MVKSLKSLSRGPYTWLLASMLGVSVNPVHAEDIVPAQAQSDAQIAVWADNAPLELFVSQLALITGRKSDIEGELEGQVSGRFNGSMAETLAALGEKHSVLFELDEGMLSAVPETARSSATIALGEGEFAEGVKTGLLSGLLSGNEVDMGEEEITVSGHPDFVQRVVAAVSSMVADADTSSSASTDTPVASNEVIQPKVANESGVVLASEPVKDVASQEMLQNDDADVSPSSLAGSSSLPKTIEWVTDIPGYETF